MIFDFLSILDDTNSIRNESTGEIIITAPSLQADGKYQINSSCKITSNCNTTISSEAFEILSSSVSLSNISFHSSIIIKDLNNITITNCTVKEAKQSDGAIAIHNSENVKLSHVTITDTIKTPGLFIYKNSLVTADNLTIHDLTETFIAINNKSFLSIKDSDLNQTKSNAFYVAGQSFIEILNCSITNTNFPSLYAKDSRCIVKNSKFENGSENAISLHSSCDFLIEKNTISLIRDTGIRISDESSGVISSNTITNVEGNGIYCHNSNITVKDNEIFDLTYPGIALTSKSKAQLLSNKISNIKYSGICIRGAKDVTVEDSEIDNVNECGISISDTENCIVRRNKITNCNLTSIEAYNKSNVHVENNDISHIGKQAFLVYTSGYMKVENNKIDDVKEELVKMLYKGGGEFINNRISKCNKLRRCKSSSFYYFDGNGDFTNVTNDPSKLSQKKSIELDENCIENGDILCIKCNLKKRNCYILDCGHKVYCKECAELAMANKENCPLCRFPIVNVSCGFGITKEDTCILCCENHSDSIVLPCGHMGVCSTCLENWFNTRQSCPICRCEPSLYKQISQDI